MLAKSETSEDCVGVVSRNMDRDMRLRKVCPQCNTVVHVKTSCCGCGHVFTLKRKVQVSADKSMGKAVKRRRALETVEDDTLRRQAQNRTRMASMRASETHEQTLRRQEQNRTRMASMIASETHKQTLMRQEQDRICTASMRASETHEQTLLRQEQDRICTASVRASETHEQTSLRQEQDRICTASMRASETHEQTLLRQEQDRICTASMIASEAREQTLRRQEQDRTHRANKRKRSLLVEDAIAAFHSEIKLGPDFVCTCCHRMMYRKSVVHCNKVKYTKTSADVLQKVFSADLSYISSGGEEWICKTCDRSLSRGYMPVQAKANGLQLCEVPPELSDLNPLELRLKACPHYKPH